MGISKTKEEESNPRSGNCTGVKDVYVYVDNGVYVLILILNICSLTFSCFSTTTCTTINCTNKYRYIFQI